MPTNDEDDLRSAAKAFSRLGASKGGKVRAERLTPEERSEIARRAVQARWAKVKGSGDEPPLPKATHTGIVRIGDVELPCAVLEGGIRVFTQRGFLDAIGRSVKPPGQAGLQADKLPVFLRAKNLKPFITKELEYASKPIHFLPQALTGGHGNLIPGNQGVALGYRVELLPLVSRVYLDARDARALVSGQMKIAHQCDLIVRGLATIGIIALVDEATGYQYDRPRKALEEILEKFLTKELGAWAKRFPDEFYENLFRLHGYQHRPGSSKRPMLFARLTVDLVYERLAPGVLEEMRRRSPKDEKGRRKNALHQWLSEDIGIAKLREHFIGLNTLMRANERWSTFYAMLNRAMPKYNFTREFDFMRDEIEEEGVRESHEASGTGSNMDFHV